uniref:Uncharacterized protein n=1 Tax=Staphylococcus phage 184DA TaxID=3110532 RepID=A0AAU6MX38_9CAUD
MLLTVMLRIESLLLSFYMSPYKLRLYHNLKCYFKIPLVSI